MKTPAPTSWGRSDTVAFVDSGERVVILALDELDALGARVLPEPAATIWRALADVSVEDAIVQGVAGTFRKNVADVDQDVRHFLIELEAQGLVLRH